MMNDGSGAGRDARRRARFRVGALIAGLVGAALLTTACGGSSSTGSTTAQLPSLQSMTAKALAYAQCMRSHGITNFPDPTVINSAHTRGVTFSVPAGVDSNSVQFKSAAKTCRKQTSFGQLSPAVLEALMANALKFTECMRSHGITNFPDPDRTAHGVQLGPGPDSGIDTNSARYKAAQKACVYLLPGGGP